MLYINFKVFMHGDFISGNNFYVWASMHYSGHKCLLPDRPEFGLNIQFDPIQGADFKLSRLFGSPYLPL